MSAVRLRTVSPVARVRAARAHRRHGTDLVERRVGRFELAARINTTIFTTKPLAVDELRAGVVDDDARTPKPFDRFPVIGPRRLLPWASKARERASMPRAQSVLLREERSASCSKADAATARSPLRVAASMSSGSTHTLNPSPSGLVGTLCCVDRFGVFALADVKCCRGSLCGLHREPFATRGRVGDDRGAQSKRLAGVSAPRRDQH